MPSKWPAGVIFDFDGVLVNSEPLHYLAFHEVLAKESIELTEAEYYNEMIGFDDRGAFNHIFKLRGRALDPKTFRQAQKAAWNKTIAATREKLGLSQTQFARLLGISVRTLHHWEQGTRKPSGAARVLLKVAAEHPEVVLKAAA